MPGTQQPEVFCLCWIADDVYERDPVHQADTVKHLPNIGSGCSVNQGAVSFATHCLDHAEYGERIDNCRGTLTRRDTVRQDKAIRRFYHAVLGEHSKRASY